MVLDSYPYYAATTLLEQTLRVYPESYAALFLTYLNGIGFCASSGASRLIIPPMALILIQASLDSVRRS